MLTGVRSGSRVSFVKTYTDFEEDDHPHYSGQVNAMATRVTGRWHFPASPGVKGTFLMARTAQAAARRTERAGAEFQLDTQGR